MCRRSSSAPPTYQSRRRYFCRKDFRLRHDLLFGAGHRGRRRDARPRARRVPQSGRAFSFRGRDAQGGRSGFSAGHAHAEFEDRRNARDGDGGTGGHHRAGVHTRANRSARRVGREFPLSAEKLSPILAFYSVLNFAGGIDLCQRLLRHGGAGHTCSIHSQNDAAIRQFGQAVPALRVCVNTSAVHGSIGYSTNLFPGDDARLRRARRKHHLRQYRPAALDECEAHRVGIARRRAPDDSGGAEARGICGGDSGSASSTSSGGCRHEAETSPAPVLASAATEPKTSPQSNVPDRQTIARIVERVFTARGIARGSAAKSEASNPSPQAPPTPADIAAAAVAEHIANSVAASPAAAAPKSPAKSAAASSAPEAKPQPTPESAKSATPKPNAPEIKIAEFVSENDIRVAMTRQQKIFIGPKTIVTPAARDLGDSHEVLVMTAASPNPATRLRA